MPETLSEISQVDFKASKLGRAPGKEKSKETIKAVVEGWGVALGKSLTTDKMYLVDTGRIHAHFRPDKDVIDSGCTIEIDNQKEFEAMVSEITARNNGNLLPCLTVDKYLNKIGQKRNAAEAEQMKRPKHTISKNY